MISTVLLINLGGGFIAALMFIFLCLWPTLLLICIIWFSVSQVIEFNVLTKHTISQWGELAKLLGTVPFGLGAVCLFRTLSDDLQPEQLLRIRTYINFAVIGNILMMLFTPPGSTWRGYLGKGSCVLLTTWLAQEINSKLEQSVGFDQGILVFRAVTMPWICCHSLYRLSLVSLPAFSSLKYLIMEPLSIGFMIIFWSVYGKSREQPVYFYFGVADTLVTAAMSTVSFALKNFDSKESMSYSAESHKVLDKIFCPIHLGIYCTSLYYIYSNS